MPLFHSYVMVDWSAASVPCKGTNSIWFSALTRTGDAVKRVALENPSTRSNAVEALSELIIRLAGAGRVLVGFDFPFGYPRGAAARMRLQGWRGIWETLAAEVRYGADRADNYNKRYDVAEAFNKSMYGEPFPFWGCERGRDREYLSYRRYRKHLEDDVPERRFCESEQRASGAQTVWKLAFPGSVGSQVLMGIPRVWHLRNHPEIEPAAVIWPFETGLRDEPNKRIVFAEIYPSLATPAEMAKAEAELRADRRAIIKDALQVIAFARRLALEDAGGNLGTLLSGDPDLSVDQRRIVEFEEGWILGLPTSAVVAKG